MKQYIGTKVIYAIPMTRKEYNDYRGWVVPEDENPDDDGYLVECAEGSVANHPNHEGYISWSPKEVFLHSYEDTSVAMTFGHAIEAAKRGCKIARKGWNGKNMWIIFNPGSLGQTHAMADGSVYKKHGVDNCEILPHFDMFTGHAMLPGWLASQSDMLAEDWYIVE